MPQEAPAPAADPKVDVNEEEEEESDEYEVEDSSGEEQGFGEEEEEEEEDEEDEEAENPAGPSGSGKASLTALLLPGQNNADDANGEDDEEFDPEGETSPTISIAGTKRSRDDEDDEEQPAARVTESGELEGDYGEVDENSDIVTKRARTSSDDS